MNSYLAIKNAKLAETGHAYPVEPVTLLLPVLCDGHQAPDQRHREVLRTHEGHFPDQPQRLDSLDLKRAGFESETEASQRSRLDKNTVLMF